MHQVIFPQSFGIGSKVEYYSDTMNGWVLSYVKGVNADGTYRLNTKKAANPGRLRPLMVQPVFVDPKPVRPLLVASSVRPQPPLVRVIPSSNHAPSALKSFIAPIPFKPQRTAGPVDLSLYAKDLIGGLGLGPETQQVRMQGFTGGQNEGIYFLTTSGGVKRFCLKVVKSPRKFENVPSERENYLTLLARFPSIMDDNSLAFPRKVFQLISSRSALFDVIVMPVAPGDRMAEVLSRFKEDKTRLGDIFAAVGTALKTFHSTYSQCQHGDLQSSNVFILFTSAGVQVSFIDLGGMGVLNVGKPDIQYFQESIQLLANTYGPDFERVASSSFFRAYSL